MKMILLSALTVLMLNANTSTPIKNTLPRTVDQTAQQNADAQLKIQNRQIIKLVVEEVGKKLPQKIDDYTMFTSIKADDLTLVSTYEINTGAKSDDAVRNEDKSRMQGFIVKGICTSSKRFLEADINITYIYTSANTKAELFRFEVNPKTCISYWNE
ncbi:hypothetical protein [Poseidonibacter ostreae]|jgi:hypothetical protein|uniref:Uncharacterized protein n=1 Tax=Poseidonibacter ostreae TaxID=2654171 RepID=A0A6L4WSF5_9BACT|nr:hypothetical protein [Poseidonibacter ostreae]KAB7887258.1 hypothetical protein GBG19_11005 [Poseidonibacter ostreae]KAB7888318.1 hypothetical protein GA417_00645 [Poseidonibacter ostreae]KAB7889529.1 hypothetical protein GBG18_10910 [Poseidonibacter ostreae]MAC82924.1 hypothetical protein [Arcobacter sp.]|tara:strand:- start:7691 stop:8161 length:471 start_codon:yes stop_codon:yes gene_type:complete